MSKKKRIESSTTTVTPPRRNFLSYVWVGLGFAALAELMWMVGAFLRPVKHQVQATAAETLIEAGPVDAFIPGSVTAFPRGRFYLARLQDGGFLAISRRCPHLGCTLPWIEEEKRFLCPCHSSAFDSRGDVVRSPAPRAMDLYPVVIENAVVKVDTHRVVKRDRFQPTQIVYSQIT